MYTVVDYCPAQPNESLRGTSNGSAEALEKRLGFEFV